MQNLSTELDFPSSESNQADYYASQGKNAVTVSGGESVMSDGAARDRKATKRIQNRIAQRTYRTRMKLRLEELQQQVTKQEREALRLQKRNNHYASGNSSSTAISKGAHDTNGNANGTTDPVDGSSVDTPHTPEYTFEISHLLPGGTNADPSSAKPAHVPASPPPLSPEKGFGQTSRVDQDGFHPSFTNISLPNSPPFPSNLPGQTKRGSARGSEPIPYPYSVPNYACPTLRMQAEFMQDRFLQDCFMQYHNHPGSRIMESDPSINYRDLSNQTGLAGASHVVGTEDSHPRRAPDLKGMSEPTSQDPIRIPPIGDDSWKPVVLAEPRRGPSLPPPDGERPTRAYSDSTDSKAGKQSIRTSSSSGTSDSPWGMQESNPLGKDATLEDRFEYVLECAKQVGFDWFDSLVANYYTADFSDRSILSNEQRLSRNRRLPGILAELREKSKGWTQWERQGYEDEILKSAESILVAECNTFKHSRNFQDGSLEDDSGKNEGGTRSSSSGPGSGSATPAIKRIFQNELPNLWTLVEALTTDNAALRQRDRSHTSFAAMLILCCSGRISATHLNVYLTEYLENQQKRGDRANKTEELNKPQWRRRDA